MGRFGSIWKEMPKMSAAVAANHFYTAHAVAVVCNFSHWRLIDGLIKTRPAAARVVFMLGTEEGGAAAYSLVSTPVMAVMVATCEGSFGAFLSCYVKLFSRKLLTPFIVVFLNFAQDRLSLKS